MWLRSHHRRLTVFAGGLFGVLLALLFVLCLIVFGQLEAQAADDALNQVLDSLQANSNRQEENLDLRNEVRVHRGVSVAIFDKTGALADSIGVLRLPNISGEGVMNTRTDLIRYVAGKLDDQNVVVGINWEPWVNSYHRLAWLLSGLWLPLTGMVMWLAWTAVGRTFRPLLDMTKEAEYLSGTNLAKRLPVPKDQEFGRLATGLNAFLERLEASVRGQEQFIADAAHELRTPLTILRGQVETTLLKDRDNEEYRRVLAIGLEEARRMSELVEMLLMSAKTNVTQPETIDISSVVLDVAERWEPRFGANNVVLNTAIEPCPVAVYRPEIESVLTNLLANALRHCPRDSVCGLELRADDGFCTMTVSDQGRGVPDNQKERIFERFYRADDGRSREVGGFGIGLAISRRIVTGRDGEIDVVDNVPRGAIFRVRLPIVKPGGKD